MPIEGDVFAIAKVLRKGALVHGDSRAVGGIFKKALKAELNKGGTGRIYTTNFFMKGGKLFKIGTRKPHQASAPGEPPAPDTRALQGSVDFDTTRERDGTTLTIGVGASAEFMEYGTSKIQPRPFFRTTIQKHLPDAIKKWADGIEKRQRAEAKKLGGGG